MLHKPNPCEIHLKVCADIVLTVCAECGQTCTVRAGVVMAAYDYCLHGNVGAEIGPHHGSLEQKCQTNSGNYTHISGDADTMTAVQLSTVACSHPDKPQPLWNKRKTLTTSQFTLIS